MSNKTYDTLRLIALIAVPATTCIVAILSALGYAHTDVVSASSFALALNFGHAARLNASTPWYAVLGYCLIH